MKWMFIVLAFLTMTALVTSIAFAYGENAGRVTGYAATLVFAAVVALLPRNRRKRDAGT
jgi:hypothetical protein